jgi:hypothetical protein
MRNNIISLYNLCMIHECPLVLPIINIYGTVHSPMLCQLSYAVRSVRVCDISEPNLVLSMSM